MSEVDPDFGDTPEPPELAPLVEGRSFSEHPLFPLDPGKQETRDIQYVTFRRRRTDGRIDHCPEDIPAGEVKSWADVIGPWGGGEYKAIGKDRNHRMIAWHPAENGGWLLFDQPSKPFTLRDGRRYERERPAPIEPARPPAPAAPPPAPASPSLTSEALLLAMVNQSAETSRAVLTAVLGQRNAEPARHEPTTIEMLRAIREWVPANASTAQPAQTSLPDQLATLRALLDMTRPSPPSPEPSILGELGGLMTTMIQTDAAARASAKPAPTAPERRAAPPRTPRLVHVPGVGLVDIVDPEPALSAPAMRASSASTLEVPRPPTAPPPAAPERAAVRDERPAEPRIAHAPDVWAATIDAPAELRSRAAPPKVVGPVELDRTRAAITKEKVQEADPNDRQHVAPVVPDAHLAGPAPAASSVDDEKSVEQDEAAVDAARAAHVGGDANEVHGVPVEPDTPPIEAQMTLPVNLAETLKRVPGMAEHSELLAEGLLQLPPEAMAFLARLLPAQDLQALSTPGKRG